LIPRLLTGKKQIKRITTKNALRVKTGKEKKKEMKMNRRRRNKNRLWE